MAGSTTWRASPHTCTRSSALSRVGATWICALGGPPRLELGQGQLGAEAGAASPDRLTGFAALAGHATAVAGDLVGAKLGVALAH